MSLTDKLRRAIGQYDMLPNGGNVIVGLSGGADSVSLLHSLNSLRNELSIKLRAVHVNHCIRGESALRDQRYCEQLCRELGVECEVRVIDIPKLAAERGIGLEQCGRECRYEAFRKASEEVGGARIATAHTLSDSCETVLFNMARGCGAQGLCGIPPVRGDIVRPLILCERSDIERYCAENSLRFMTDETNSDTAYSRNMIRCEIIPRLTGINPGFASNVGRMTALLNADNALLERLASSALNEARNGDGWNVERLAAMDEALLGRAVIMAVESVANISPQHRHIELIEKYLRSGESGAVELSAEYTARIRGGLLVIDRNVRIDAEPFCVPLSFGEMRLANGRIAVIKVVTRDEYDENVKNSSWIFKNALDYGIIADNVNVTVLRSRREGDRIALAGHGCTSRVKKLLCDAHIPTELRSRLAMLETDGRLVWLERFGVAEGFQVTANTERVLHIQMIQ